MSRRAMLTVSAAAGLSGLCAGYVTLTRPLLRPAAGVEHRPFDVNAAPLPEQKNELAERYLPDQPWAADAEWTVRNGRSVLFFNKQTPTEDGKAISLKPFAMVFPPKPGAASDEPMTIVGDEAILQVEGSLKLEDAKPGRIIGGRVPGPVRLRGPDGLDLQGSVFHFNESPAPLIWSDEPVTFRHGPHSGRGHGFQIELFRVGPLDAFESIAVSGVNVLRLLRDVEMDLQLDDARGGPFGAIAGDQAADAPRSQGETLPTRVTSKGSFTFNVRTNEAVFAEDVVATRATPGGAADSLECDMLGIAFAPATEEAKHAAAERRAKIDAGTLTEDDGFQSVDDALALQWLAAYGTTKPAVLRSPSNEFTAELGQLTYVAATGVTTLTREGGAVDAHQGSSRLVSPTITIEPVDGGGPPTVVCGGKGWMQHFDPPGRLALTARWEQALRRWRAPDGLDLIQLNGAAEVHQPEEQFTLVGERIDLWVNPNAAGMPDAGKPTPLVATGRMEPVRLVAECPALTPEGMPNRGVKLRSPELLADAMRLDVTFVAPAAPAATAGTSRSRLLPTSGRIVLASAEQAAGPPAAPAAEPRPIVRSRGSVPAATAPAEQIAPAQNATSPAAPAAAAPPMPPQPIELEAEVINVIAERPRQDAAPSMTAARGGGAREVHTTGGVTVRQRRGDGEEPLYITGDRLDLFNRGEGQELVHVYGMPAGAGPNGEVEKTVWAHVHDQGADLYGLNVNLDRSENRAWVDGRGAIELPATGASRMLRLDEEETDPPPTTASAEEPERLTVWWSERMDFDGDRATFYGGVRTTLRNDQMACTEMEVRLTARFDFAAAGRQGAAPSARPEVAEVICRNGVRVVGEEREADRLVSVRRARFHEFRLDERTGDTTAVGPGEIEMWQRGDANRAALAADNAVRANASIRRGTDPWEYLFVSFDGTSDGNIRHRETTFHRNVRVVYGPVAEPGRTIDPHRPDKAPAEAGWMTCKALTLTQHKKTDAAAAYSEILGEGNVRLDGRGFAGVADQVAYDESKGQYVLKSFGRLVATVAKRNLEDGSPAGDMSGQEIRGYPARSQWQVVKATGFDGAQ